MFDLNAFRLTSKKNYCLLKIWETFI